MEVTRTCSTQNLKPEYPMHVHMEKYNLQKLLANRTSIRVIEESGRRRGPTDAASAVNVNLDARSSLASASTYTKYKACNESTFSCFIAIRTVEMVRLKFYLGNNKIHRICNKRFLGDIPDSSQDIPLQQKSRCPSNTALRKQKQKNFYLSMHEKEKDQILQVHKQFFFFLVVYNHKFSIVEQH